MSPHLLTAATEREAGTIAAGTTLGEQIAEALAEHPGAVIADDHRSLHFGDLLLQARAKAATADGPGGAFLLESRNDLQFVVEFLAALLARRIPVLAMPGSLRAEDVRAIDRAEIGRDTAFLLTSGGTTGRPKLIARRHGEYLLNVWLSARNARLDNRDVLLIPIPAAHNYALGCPGILGALLHGASVVLTEQRRLADLTSLVERHRVTVLPLVPTQVRAGSARPPRTPVRLVQVGGSPVTAADVVALRGHFRAEVQTSFGMAEGLLCQSAPEDSDELREAGIGRMLSADDEYRIVGRDASGAGRLEVRGPYTIKGYLADPAVNAARFTADGWFRTGDYASAVSDRRFRVHGRADDVINRGGELIEPTAVEALVRRHPAVADVAAVGDPHPVLGQIVTAFVVPAGSVAPEALLLDLLREHRDVPAVPDRVIVVPELPLTAVGKVDHRALLTDHPRKKVSS